MSLSKLRATRSASRTKTFKHLKLPMYDVSCDDTTDYRTYVLPDGTRFYSMTSMLKMTSDDSWLKEWRERIGEEEAKAEAKRCADRGEGVHLACEHYLNNEPMDIVLEAAGMYVDLFYQIKRVLDVRVGAVVAQEIPLFSRLMRVAGRVDLVCYWLHDDGKYYLSIVDFKTSNGIKLKGEIGTYQCQLAGYAQCFREMYNLLPKHLVNIIACEKTPHANNIPFTTSESLPKLAIRVKEYHQVLKDKGLYDSLDNVQYKP